MSSCERSVRYFKQQTDSAISEAYSRLAPDPNASVAFTELLSCARARSPRMLEGPAVAGRHQGVEALLHLSRFARAHLRPIAGWPGSRSSCPSAVDSLAQHLLCAYRIPAFLSGAWYAADEPYGDEERRWFIGHAAGASFRSLGLPIELTRRMEHIFLRSADHLGIACALRRAELLGLGADVALAGAVLATRPALELEHGDFWRTAWIFLIANAGAIDRSQIGPLVDFFHGIRHERVAVETPDGTSWREPPQPQFSLKGRTARSVLRLMDEWHRGLGLVTGGFSWERSRIRPMVVEVPSEDPSNALTSWEMIELTTSAQLRAEGAALQHCVAGYAHACARGTSRIWSLRRRCDADVRSVVTLEVNPVRRTIVQLRGFKNRRVSGRALQIVQTWASREHLRLAL